MAKAIKKKSTRRSRLKKHLTAAELEERKVRRQYQRFANFYGLSPWFVEKNVSIWRTSAHIVRASGKPKRKSA